MRHGPRTEQPHPQPRVPDPPTVETWAPRRPGGGLGRAPVARKASTTPGSVSNRNTQAPEPRRTKAQDFPYPQQHPIPFSALGYPGPEGPT